MENGNGLDILLKTYWSREGWKDGSISEEDFELAKKEGYMFEYPKVYTHTEALERLDELLSKVNPQDVANAFLYSLSTRKLEYRSILGSYYYGKAIPKHDFVDSGAKRQYCCYCCWISWKESPDEYDIKHGLNVYNFERYKFGGVRHAYLNYVLFDLEQFLKLPKVIPSEKDKEILKSILGCVSKLNSIGKVGKLRDLIIKERLFKSNKHEISVILEELGICGILASKEYPCYEDKFVGESYRSASEHHNDFKYPVNRWTAKDGVNFEKFKNIFDYDLR